MRNVITLVLTLILGSASAADVNWPALSTLDIDRCGSSSCTTGVYYKPGPTVMTRAPGNTPKFLAGTKVRPFGVHCSKGMIPGNFTSCYLYIENGHAPALTGVCELKASNRWVLTDASTCSIDTSVYGRHDGAGPGSECVVFGVGFGNRPPYVATPWGELTGAQIANSDEEFCIKPRPPNAKCELTLSENGVLDHGIVAPNSVSERTLSLFTDCGESPKIQLNGPNPFTLGNGVTADLTSIYVNKDLTYLKSRLRTANAKPGNYSATYIVVVNPN